MKKIWMILLVITLMTVSFVAGAIINKSEWIEKYPNSPVLRSYEICDGDLSCLKQRGRVADMIVVDETDYEGYKIIRVFWYE